MEKLKGVYQDKLRTHMFKNVHYFHVAKVNKTRGLQLRLSQISQSDSVRSASQTQSDQPVRLSQISAARLQKLDSKS